MAAVREKSVVLPNGVDALWLENRPAPRTAPGGAGVNLLFVGQLIPRKNLPAAIAAAEALSARGRKARLTVGGPAVDPHVAAAARASALVTLEPPRPMQT
jgi:glycosyltransferase involved in cell wall biosynthesis